MIIIHAASHDKVYSTITLSSLYGFLFRYTVVRDFDEFHVLQSAASNVSVQDLNYFSSSSYIANGTDGYGYQHDHLYHCIMSLVIGSPSHANFSTSNSPTRADHNGCSYKQ